SRMAASAFEVAKSGALPVYSSRYFTSSMEGRSTVSQGALVKWPASPIIVFSMSALQGQTVTQCPHETQDDSLMGRPPSQSTRGCSASQSIESVSVTWTFWQASTQRPQRMHWSGSYW